MSMSEVGEIKGDHVKNDESALTVEEILAALVNVQQYIWDLHSMGYVAATHRKAMDWAVEKARKETAQCEWANDEDGIWYGNCGIVWAFDGGDGPTMNGVKFCPSCGRELLEQEMTNETE